MRDAAELARAAVDRRAWDEACARLTAADEQGLLREPEDLQRLALSAYLAGRDEVAETGWMRAYQAFQERGDVRAAVRCAFWLGMVLVLARGAEARGAGWLARAHRLLADAGPHHCAERGYLLLPGALKDLTDGDPRVAHAAFGDAAAIGEDFHDEDLVTLARLGQGQSLIRTGEVAAGLELLDEAMVALDAGRVSPIPAGLVYCAVILASQEACDVRRAQQWTAAMTGWCAAQPGLVPFRGQCLVHRSQLAQLRGDWAEAILEADRSCRWLSDRSDPAAGTAFYQRAELHRLRGEEEAAEEAFGLAAARGHDPHPGLALLWLDQGRTGAAVAAMRRVLDEGSGDGPGGADRIHAPRPRAEVLAAAVEVLLAGRDLERAGRACAGLEGAAAGGTTLVRATAARTRGMVLLAEDRPGPALRALTEARSCWVHLQAPYETARTRVLVGRALRALGDEDTAAVEERAARRVFQEVGAAPDLRRLDGSPAHPAGDRAAGLTARELDVIRLLAAGHTNRAIAGELFISDTTVARHVHNVLTKLDLPNRSAATAYAYEHGLVEGRIHRTV